MLIYTILLTLISIVTAVIYPAAFHTSIYKISGYLYYSQLFVVPAVIWLIYIFNRKYKYLSNTYASIINTALLVAIPFASGVMGNLIIDHNAALFEKLKDTIIIENINDQPFYSKNGMPIGITIEFKVTSPGNIRLYPYATLKSDTQPKEILVPRYPEFRYHECELKDKAGNVIFTSNCNDLHPSMYSHIGWSKHMLKSGESYYFSINMVPDNCVSPEYSVANIGRPFTSSDYGLDVPVNYKAEIMLFRDDGTHITTITHTTNSQYLPKNIYKNLSAQKNIICG